MTGKLNLVHLSAEERTFLEPFARSYRHSARERTRARILLLTDEDQEGGSTSDRAIARQLRTSAFTVERVRRRYVEGGLERALFAKEQERRAPRRLDGAAEAHLIALTCAAPPEGYKRWSLRLLRDTLIEQGYVDQVSHEAVRRTLKKNALKPWARKCWCIPPKQSAEFVYHMEDVLDVYQRAYDPAHPLVCLDEASLQLLGDVREPLPMEPEQPERYDSHYVRQGTVNLFLLFEPLSAWRHVEVTERRTRVEFAQVVRELVEVRYPEAERIVLVMDQLNTHSAASLYQAFPPQEAKRRAEKLEIQYTPMHGTWLNMAEIELSVLARQCLKSRMQSKANLQTQIAAWEARRNQAGSRVDWRFTTADARIKLKRLYPAIQA